MSHQLISRSRDLKRLRDEGYDIEVRAGLLLVKSVPYVKADRSVCRGILISKLELAGDVTTRPSDHTAHFEGGYPHSVVGEPIELFRHSSPNQKLLPGLIGNHYFSAKPNPSGQYVDYYEKVTVYLGHICTPASRIDAAATPITWPIHVPSEQEDDVFRYIDTATSRAELDVISGKLKISRVAIIGLGGTGSYILDFLAKTPVKEIHLFDGDAFLQHNAFRCPGAASIADLETKQSKVDYLFSVYDKMRAGIIPHATFIDADNVASLVTMDFVFLCLDTGKAKARIIKALEDAGISFIDVGLGVYEAEVGLAGLIRVTTSTPDQRAHIHDKGRISLDGDNGDNNYDRNIQIAELNALNAAMAILKWKKLMGFYRDMEGEFFSGYSIATNHIVNEDSINAC